jgi:glycerol-3-phosphate acyltransferase PlsX
MADTITTSLDVMGGDRGPMQVLPGADIALARRPDIRYRLFGDEKIVRPLLDQYPRLREASTLEHSQYSVRMDEKPSQALRRGRRHSSM